MEYILVGCRSVIVLVFVVSAVTKLRSRRTYSEFVAATGRLSPRPVAATTAQRLAAAVVAGELAVVALVLVPVSVTPVAVPLGFAAAAALLVAFTGAILMALRRGVRAPCRCFGSTAQPLGYAQVVRNLVLLVVAVGGLVAGASGTAAPELASALLAVVAGAVVATVAVMTDDLAALFRPV